MEGNNSKTCKSCLTSFWQNSKKLHNSETRPVDLMSSQKDNSVKLILLLNKFLANLNEFSTFLVIELCAIRIYNGQTDFTTKAFEETTTCRPVHTELFSHTQPISTTRICNS